MSAHPHHRDPDTYRKREASRQRTIERYQGVLAMIATWEPISDPHDPHIRHLKIKLQKLRAQIRNKGQIDIV